MFGIQMSNNCYDVLNFICRMIMPFADFVAAICAIWGLPYATQIVSTLTALHTLLGLFLTESKKAYDKKQAQDNYIVVQEPIDESEVDG